MLSIKHGLICAVALCTMWLRYSVIATLAQGVLDMESAEAARRGEVYRIVSNRMDNAARAYTNLPHEPARRHLYRHCRRHVARRRGGIAAWLWFAGGWIDEIRLRR